MVCDASLQVLFMDNLCGQLTGIPPSTACSSTLWQLFGLTGMTPHNTQLPLQFDAIIARTPLAIKPCLTREIRVMQPATKDEC